MLRFVVVFCVLFAPGAFAAVPGTFKFNAQGKYLAVEVLTDDLLHVEWSAKGEGPAENSRLDVSPMVARTEWPGPKQFSRREHTFETGSIRAEVNPETLCLAVTYKPRDLTVTTLCPERFGEPWKSLAILPHTITHVYGLGQYFRDPGNPDLNWVGREWHPGPMGNQMRSFSEGGFNGGAPSYAQIPVLYALGSRNENYALFLDQPYKIHWDFRHEKNGGKWFADTWGDQVRAYVMTGPDLPSLRKAYLEITGRPPVPPKKVLGLWMSQFGYTSWGEMDDIHDTLKAKGFPLDGFGMDLQWYGGFFDENGGHSSESRMGSLRWNTGVDWKTKGFAAFPDPQRRIDDFRAKGVELMLIEQSYVNSSLPVYERFAKRHLFSGWINNPADPAFLDQNPWWGRGAMLDWSNPETRRLWHDEQRVGTEGDPGPVRQGIRYHWTDLGEPEMYRTAYSDEEARWFGQPEAGAPLQWYHGFWPGKHTQADVHNVYNLLWLKGIYEGYERTNPNDRFYSMSRSAAAGIQRYGAGMWSGDIGANMKTMAEHVKNLGAMSGFLGVSTYSSDIGGFHRWCLDGNLEELYTQWFAMGSWLDIPVRPHVWNLEKDRPNQPYRVQWGKDYQPELVASNRENIRQRYALTPYYYSLLHRASRDGEPPIAPLVYHFQNDATLRSLAHEMMVGPSLLVGIVARYGETDRTVYLPAGRWFDFHSGAALTSRGEWIDKVPVYRDGLFKLPVYARAGALLPKMKVDEATRTVDGLRADGTRKTDLVVRVFSDEEATSFTLYEDDGVSRSYEREGKLRTTELSQKRTGDSAVVTIAASRGEFEAQPAPRNNVVELVTAGASVKGVKLAGNALPLCASQEELEKGERACYLVPDGGNLALAQSGPRTLGEEKRFEFELGAFSPKSEMYFVCRNASTNPGESVYVAGNLRELGAWDLHKALKLDPGPYPTWTGSAKNLPADTEIEWKCFRLNEATRQILGEQKSAGNNRNRTPGGGRYEKGEAEF